MAVLVLDVELRDVAALGKLRRLDAVFRRLFEDERFEGSAFIGLALHPSTAHLAGSHALFDFGNHVAPLSFGSF